MRGNRRPNGSPSPGPPSRFWSSGVQPKARAAEGCSEASAEAGVHPTVDDGVVSTAAHRHPMADDPDGLDVFDAPDDPRYGVSDQSDDV